MQRLCHQMWGTLCRLQWRQQRSSKGQPSRRRSRRHSSSCEMSTIVVLPILALLAVQTLPQQPCLRWPQRAQELQHARRTQRVVSWGTLARAAGRQRQPLGSAASGQSRLPQLL